MCGPLSRAWCMRYEGKHSFFRRTATLSHNFKNVEKTLASRHQQYMCDQMCNPTEYLTGKVCYPKGKFFLVLWDNKAHVHWYGFCSA